MSDRQVKCINKRDRYNRHEKISHIGGDWGWNNSRIRITEDEAIHDIETRTHTYYVQVGYSRANVIVSSYDGRKYLKTDSDDTTKDNLLSLPECS